MDTDSVRLFALAAEKLNISAAGRELGMAPAVASSKLAKLEKALGADLLRRSTRKVALSVEGQDFLPYAKEIIAQENAARAALGLGKELASGTLRFTAPSSFAQLYIAPILPEFLSLHPGINLDLRLTDTTFDLIQGSFDLALRNAELADSSMKGRQLADDARILCASPEYLAEHGTPNDPADLERHQLVLFSEKSHLKLINTRGEEQQVTVNSAECRLLINEGTNQKIATVAGAGISINSIWSVHQQISDGTLVRVLPDHKINDQTALWLVYPKSNMLTAKVRVFIDFLSEKIGRSPPWISEE